VDQERFAIPEKLCSFSILVGFVLLIYLSV